MALTEAEVIRGEEGWGLVPHRSRRSLALSASGTSL